MVYYPLSKIKANLYTQGGEYKLLSTDKDYKGFYFSTYDGKYFTEKTPSDKSEELIKYNSGTPLTTLTSLQYGRTDQPGTQVVHSVNVPTDKDYENGVYTRYFVRRINGDDSTIKELSQQTYSELQNNPLYILAQGEWTLTGTVEDTTTPQGFVIPGVSSKNKKVINDLLKVIKGINLYLTDPLQYYK